MSRSRTDALLKLSLLGCAALAGVIVLLIAVFLFKEAVPLLRDVGVARFFTDASWHATQGRYNLVPMLAGTLGVTVGAVAVATPVGLLSAVFCRFYAPGPTGVVYRRVVELLAGVPSVVYGFWGLVVLVPMIARWHPPGASLLAGILVLAVMIVPTVALVAESALRGLPASYMNAAAGVGLDRTATVWKVAVPAARGGIVTGVVLAVGRAVGEVMAVLMVCGNVVQVPDSLFAPVRTLTANIALEMAYALGDHRRALFVTGLLLLLLVVALVAVAEWASRGRHACESGVPVV